MNKSPNPPAFPPGTHSGQKGMSLRDWFAGQALVGFMASDELPEGGPEEVAATAYLIADYMLGKRQQ